MVERTMKHPHFLAIATFLLATFSVGPAQTPEKCQLVSIEVSTKEVDEGSPIVFTAKLNTVVPTAKPEFKWQTSAGTTTAGEGTASITVDTAGLGGQVVTATVEVGGVSTTCSTVTTGSASIKPALVRCGRPFDTYGDIRFEDEKARLDSFAIGLVNYEAATGYIIAYAGRQSYQGEAAARLLRAKNYLVKVRTIDPASITTVDGGYSEDFHIKLIIVPLGATPPSEFPTFPTLTLAEIEFTKPRPSDLTRRRPRKLKEY
jgi:hypothetical protein